jgi:tetratricopeptide (TPR) repeat protein
LASEPERKPAKQPKLIGGSLPVYQRMPGEPEKGSFDASGGFRPPEPVSAPPVVDANDYEARLQAARRAFWNGEFELAEAGYVELITIHPDDADAFGELGNLYETMGEWQLAKDAYFAAGERLKQAGEIEKLNHVIDLLEGKGDARAQRLRQP